MRGHADKRSYIEIDMIEINLKETKVSRRHIKAEGFSPASIVALNSSQVLGTFGKNRLGFLSRIIGLFRKLRQHYYLFHGFPSLQTIWVGCCF